MQELDLEQLIDSKAEVVEIYAQNGKPVEFGQKLFRIKKA